MARRYATLVSIATVVTMILAGTAAAGKPEEATQGGWTIGVTVDREDGLYKAGDTITFAVSLTKDGKPAAEGEVAYEITLNGPKSYATGTVRPAAEGGQVPVVTPKDQPWCLMLLAKFKLPDGKEIKAEAGAVSGAELLKPSTPTPDDFDAFWADQKKKLAAVPMNPKLTPVPPPVESMAGQVECFDVQVDCAGGAPVSGYYARPKGAKPRSCPAAISFHGAGVRSSVLAGPAGDAAAGRISMNINAHGIANGKPDEYYKELLETGALKLYWFKGADNREACYFLGMYLRVLRAMEFLTAQPEWDGRILIASGGSQGGAQSIVAAGLNPQVTLVNASLPALCDLTGQAAGRASGWPFGTRKLSDAEMSAMRYFDVSNFAARTKATVVVRVGLVDRTCWPAGVLAMCNRFQGEKRILTCPLSGHGYSPPEDYSKANKVFEEVRAAAMAKAAAGAHEEKAKP